VGIWRRLTDAQNRAAADILDPRAREVKAATGDSDFSSLAGHGYCLLVSFRRNGETVPTPVWFGLDDGSVYVRTDAASGKVRRIRREQRVLVAPCDRRGTPLGPAVEGRARVLPKAEEGRAERALNANYGVGRRLYNVVTRFSTIENACIEITPAAREPG
jgi:PPOX class probable F420-dependent enzyme